MEEATSPAPQIYPVWLISFSRSFRTYEDNAMSLYSNLLGLESRMMTYLRQFLRNVYSLKILLKMSNFSTAIGSNFNKV